MVGNFVASRAKAVELSLDGDESRAIAEAGANVLKQYSIPVDEKTAAWLALAGTLGTIYGAKIAAMKINRSLSKGA